MKILLNPEILNSEQQEYAIKTLMDIKELFPDLKCIWNDSFYVYLYSKQTSFIHENNYFRWISKNANEIFANEELSDSDCYSEPIIEFTEENIKETFYCIVHKLIENGKNFIPFLHLVDIDTYTFRCYCHQNVLIAKIFDDFTKFISINYKNIINEYWPYNIQDFEKNFWILISTISIEKMYEIKYLKENIKFTSNFMKNFMKLDVSKREIYINKIAMKLSKTYCNANSLKDEPIRRINGTKRRFRLSDVDRIHYSYINNNHNMILFEELNIENHNSGL